MKVYKPGTDCEVDLTIFANGKPCPEFVFPDAIDEPNAAICFIPVVDDSMITIQGDFTGSVLHSRIDVLADGAFVANRTIEDPLREKGRLKFWQDRKLEVKTFLHVPDLNNHKYRREPHVVEGNLIVKRLSAQELAGPLNGGDDASSIGVGSITLIVSMNQKAEDTYGVHDEPAYPSTSLGHWRDNIAEVVDSGIKPEHEMTMEVFPASNPVKDKRANQFRQMVKGVRFGSEPWVYMVFYYRTQAAIDAAGCVLLAESKALQPDDGTFVRACDQVTPDEKVPESTTSSAPAPTPESKEFSEETSNLESEQEPEPMRMIFSTPDPEPRRRMGLGQALLLGGSPGTYGPLPRSVSGSTGNSLSKTMAGGLSQKSSSEQRSSNSKAEDARSSMRPPNPKQRATLPEPESLKPTTPFSQPLSMVLSTQSATGNINSDADQDSKVDDLAAPSLPTFRPRTKVSRSTALPFPMPSSQPSPVSSKDSLPASKLLPRKRAATPAENPGATSPPSARASPALSTSRSPAATKRLRLEEMQRKKTEMLANLQAKKDRAAAAQKKLDEEKRHREEQQRLWAEEEAKRQAEEEAKRQAEEEAKREAEEEEEARQAEEAMMAEMEALERENEQADEDMARLLEEEERDRMEWEQMVRERENGGMDDH